MHLYSALIRIRVCLFEWNWEMKLEVGIEGKGVKMESRGKLGNDEM